MFPQPTNLIPLHMAKACSPLPAKKQAKNRVTDQRLMGWRGNYARAATNTCNRFRDSCVQIIANTLVLLVMGKIDRVVNHGLGRFSWSIESN